MKTTSLKSILTSATMGVALAAVLAGCGSTTTTNPPAQTNEAQVEAQAETPVSQAVGTLLLSVNPEIEIEYDDKGLVTEIEGVNDEGRGVVGGYGGYEGRECREVVSELVGEIYEAGHFNQTVDGHDRNVVVKLEQGSSYPGRTSFAESRAAFAKRSAGSALRPTPLRWRPSSLTTAGTSASTRLRTSSCLSWG